MTANKDLVFAAISGGGTAGTALARFAPYGTPLPTSATAVLNVAFVDPGWCSEDGLKKTMEEDSTDVNAFGSSVPIRTLVTKSKATFEIVFLESGPIPVAIYNRLALDALEPDVDGAFDFTEGAARVANYAAVFDLADGDNHIRAVVPSVQVTNRQTFEGKAGTPITYGVTLTAYPSVTDGVAIHWYYVMGALAT